MFRHVSASRLQNVYCLKLAFDPRRENDISSYISPKSFIQTANALCLTKRLFIKVSMVRRSRSGGGRRGLLWTLRSETRRL